MFSIPDRPETHCALPSAETPAALSVKYPSRSSSLCKSDDIGRDQHHENGVVVFTVDPTAKTEE
ncbi:hypothetical protein, partial [Escherichia coli]|uniref:hypothetical protein n=1 Tax=Escherichia coli TaxID=562 RepID=UPI0019CFE3B4